MLKLLVILLPHGLPMVKKAKKRGVKPGTRRGRYKKVKDYKLVDIKGNPVSLGQLDKIMNYTPAPVLTLCGQLEDSIMLLETRISNAIAKINSLM